MTTLGGDLIRMLAHGGISTLGNVGAQLLANYLKPGMEVRETAGKALLGALGTGTEEEANAAAQTLKENYGVEWPTTMRTNPAGVEISGPTGAKLTQPRATLNDLAPGYEVQRGLVRPAPALEALKSKILTSLTPEEQKTAAFPKERSLEAALINKQMEIEARGAEGALNRESREAIARDSMAARATQQQDSLALRQATLAQTQQWRDFLKTHMQDKILAMTDKQAAGQTNKELGLLISLEGRINSAKDKNEKAKFMEQANTLIQNSSDPILKTYPLWTEDAPVSGTGLDLGPLGVWGATKEKVPMGQKSKAPAANQVVPKAAAPTITTPTLSAIQEEKRRRGLIK